MNKFDLVNLWRKRIANGSISGTTLRNQGKGVAACVREYLKQIDLHRLQQISNAGEFEFWLDEKTEELQSEIHHLLKTRSDADVFWGTARKSLNLYLLECCYNTVLRDVFLLSHVENFLEVPLDSQVAKHLQEVSKDKLPRWHSFKWLTPEDHKKYQDCALSYAQKEHLKRAQLDLVFWRNEADE